MINLFRKINKVIHILKKQEKYFQVDVSIARCKEDLAIKKGGDQIDTEHYAHSESGG